MLSLLAATPTPGTSSPPPFVNQTGGGGAGAGTAAFALIVGLIVLSILLFWAMNRSLGRARRNLGGSTLPRRGPGRRPPSRYTIPIVDDDPPMPDEPPPGAPPTGTPPADGSAPHRPVAP